MSTPSIISAAQKVAGFEASRMSISVNVRGDAGGEFRPEPSREVATPAINDDELGAGDGGRPRQAAADRISQPIICHPHP